MLKKIIALVLICYAGLVVAQDSASTKILLVPYNPDMYLSDIEQDIIKNTNMLPVECRSYFRKSLHLKILGELNSYRPTVSLLADNDSEDNKELREFYAQAGYSYLEAVGNGVGTINDKKKKLFEKKSAEEKAPLYITTRGDDKFMNAAVTNKEYFKKLLQENGCNYAVSINQFEFKTNYSSCIDLSKQIYRRELIIHYSIIGLNGQLVAGNFLVIYFPSNVNKPQEVAEKTFKSVSSALLMQLKSALSLENH